MTDTFNIASRRQVLAKGGAAFAASTFPMPAIAQALTELNIGSANSASDVSIFLADKKGWFKDERIAIKVSTFNSAANMVAPLGAGHLDIGGGSVSAGLYNAVSRGIKLRIVADKASSQPGYGVNKCLIAKRHVESGRYKELKDIKGMKVGMNGPGNSSWGSMWGALKLAGLKLSDVETVDMSYPDHVLAYTNNSIDASFTTEPSGTVAIMRGLAVEATSDDKTRPYHAIAQILFSEKLASNRDLAVRFMRAYLRAARYYHGALKDGRLAGDNAEEIIQVLTEYTPIKDPQVYRTIVPNGIDPDGKVNIPTLKEDYEVYKMQGWIEGAATVEDVIDMSFVEAALKDLGPYKRG